MTLMNFRSVAGSVLVLVTAIASDPTGTFWALLITAWQQAGTLFTVTSVIGFTIGPEFPAIPTGLIQTTSIFFGVLFVLTLLNKVWDNLKGRLS